VLASAAKTVAGARYCWLATAAENGVPSARPMGRLPRDPDDDEWTIRFVTDGRSRKASEIQHADKVAVIFQRGDDAFVTVIGAAMLREGAGEIRRRWKHAYDAYFPGEEPPRENGSTIGRAGWTLRRGFGAWRWRTTSRLFVITASMPRCCRT
jgi:general stress protein 26